MENGTVRLSGTGREVLEHPEIGELYLGGAVSDQETPEARAAEARAAGPARPHRSRRSRRPTGPGREPAIDR